jgi:predicted DNA-binding transcriptional regulator AlpA
MERSTFIRINRLATTPSRQGRLPLSANSIWRLTREGKFPQPVRLSPGTTAWRLSDIEAWEAAREAIK